MLLRISRKRRRVSNLSNISVTPETLAVADALAVVVVVAVAVAVAFAVVVAFLVVIPGGDLLLFLLVFLRIPGNFVILREVPHGIS